MAKKAKCRHRGYGRKIWGRRGRRGSKGSCMFVRVQGLAVSDPRCADGELELPPFSFAGQRCSYRGWLIISVTSTRSGAPAASAADGLSLGRSVSADEPQGRVSIRQAHGCEQAGDEVCSYRAWQQLQRTPLTLVVRAPPELC